MRLPANICKQRMKGHLSVNLRGKRATRVVSQDKPELCIMNSYLFSNNPLLYM